MRIAPAPVPLELLAPIVALLRFWLEWTQGVLARIGVTARGPRLTQMVEGLEALTETTLLLRAINCAPRRMRRRTPLSTPPGFRRSRFGLRLLRRSGRARLRGGDLCARVAHLFDVLAAPGRAIARLVRQLRGLTTRLVVVAPPAIALFSAAPAPALIAADSS